MRHCAMDEAAYAKLVNASHAARAGLKQILVAILDIKSELAVKAIERNSNFATLNGLGYATSYVDHDWEMQSALERIAAEVTATNREMVNAVEAMSAICQSQVEASHADTGLRIAAEQALVALKDRMKEHALHNERVRDKVWAITDGKCFYCEVELVRTAEGNDRSRLFHIDHIVPKASGGPDHISNYVPACERCNISKNAKSFVEFYGSSMLAKREKLREEVLGQ